MTGSGLNMTLDMTIALTTGLDLRMPEIPVHRPLRSTEGSQSPYPTNVAVDKQRLTVSIVQTIAAIPEPINPTRNAMNALRSRPPSSLVPVVMCRAEAKEIPVGKSTRAGPTNMPDTSLGDPDSHGHTSSRHIELGLGNRNMLSMRFGRR
jgi:hypothetical protein